MTITQIQYINVQEMLVVIFEFTGVARGFMIMSCAARGVKKVGQHWIRECSVSYTMKRRVYVFVCLFVCMFTLSLVLLTSRLTQALKIASIIVFIFCGAVNIFLTSYVLSFKSYEFF